MTQVENPSEIVEEAPETLTNKTPENAREELSEDMEVIGPGQMLSDGRKNIGLSQQDVANRLNFRKTLVNSIENEEFDASLPETFNRGYLRNYAKLVNVSQEDVLASYEQLNVAKTQASELQSFSKGTEKLAESNRIMWVSYLILAILAGSTVMWWMQDTAEQASVAQTVTVKNTEQKITPQVSMTQVDTPQKNEKNEKKAISTAKSNDKVLSVTSVEEQGKSKKVLNDTVIENTTIPVMSPVILEQERSNEHLVLNADATREEEKEPVLTSVTFTFSGDCWVNISDATGERIAWGVKRLGYVMQISGQAPFNVTLGKPELVAINFSGKTINMNQFNAGNIAKFTLPVTH
jgi:cytoskeleton protein RodZ